MIRTLLLIQLLVLFLPYEVNVPTPNNQFLIQTDHTYKLHPHISPNKETGQFHQVPNQNCNCSYLSNHGMDFFVVIYYHFTHSRRVKSIPVNPRHCVRLYLIILSGDIALNPGPIRNPFGGCYKPVAKSHRGIYCEACYHWWHIKCANITGKEYLELANCDDPWIYEQCKAFHFTDSFFNHSFLSVDQSVISARDNGDIDNYEPLTVLKQQNPRYFTVGYININSVRNKFYCIQDLLMSNNLDLIFIAETKIDNSFPDSQFSVNNYHMWRADRSINGGGILAYLRSDIAGERKQEYEFEEIESIAIQVNLDKSKLLIFGSYKHPSITNTSFQVDFDLKIDKSLSKFENIVVIGDLNYDMLCTDKSQTLRNCCDIFALDNLISEPTCFTVNNAPSLIDVILTNNTYVLGNTCNFDCGLSDCHNLVGFQVKQETNKPVGKYCTYRSYKNFNPETYNEELYSNLQNLDMSQNDVNKLYNEFSNILTETVNKHAPLKQRKLVKQPAPFMNKALKYEIYKKRMLFNKYKRNKTPKTWEKFRRQRNLVTSLRRRSLNKYFIDRCTGGCKSETFWSTVKPFLTNKGNKITKDTILDENESIKTDQKEICNIFNNFFVNVAKISEKAHLNLWKTTQVLMPLILKKQIALILNSIQSNFLM